MEYNLIYTIANDQGIPPRAMNKLGYFTSIDEFNKIFKLPTFTYYLSTVQQSNSNDYDLAKTIAKASPKAQLISLQEVPGMGQQIYLNKIISLIEDDQKPVIICDYSWYDEFCFEQFEDFLKYTRADACVVVSKGFNPNLMLDRQNVYVYGDEEENRVTCIKHDDPYHPCSEHVDTRIYYFKSGSILKQALKNYFMNNKNKTDGDVFDVMNDMLKNRANIRYFLANRAVSLVNKDQVSLFNVENNLMSNIKDKNDRLDVMKFYDEFFSCWNKQREK